MIVEIGGRGRGGARPPHLEPAAGHPGRAVDPGHDRRRRARTRARRGSTRSGGASTWPARPGTSTCRLHRQTRRSAPRASVRAARRTRCSTWATSPARCSSTCAGTRCPRLTVAGGVRKLAKLAAGHLDLHSGRSQVDLRLAGVAAPVAAELPARVREANTAHATRSSVARQAGVPLADLVAAGAREVALGVLRRGAGRRVEVSWSDRAGEIVGRRLTATAEPSRGGCRGSCSAASAGPTRITAVRRTPAAWSPGRRCRPACRAGPPRRPGSPARRPRPGSRRRSAGPARPPPRRCAWTARCSTSVAPAAAERGQLLARRHRRGAAGDAGEDHGLADAGHGQLAAQRGRGGGERGHARGRRRTGRPRASSRRICSATALKTDGSPECSRATSSAALRGRRRSSAMICVEVEVRRCRPAGRPAGSARAARAARALPGVEADRRSARSGAGAAHGDQVGGARARRR